MTDDGHRDSDLELRAKREGKSLADLVAEGYVPRLAPRRCPTCEAEAVELVYRCGARSTLTPPNLIHTTACTQKRPRTTPQIALPLPPKGGPR